MIEPTETEPKETLDEFADAMLAIAREAEETTRVAEARRRTRGRCRRLDEVLAAKRAIVKYGFGGPSGPRCNSAAAAPAGSPERRLAATRRAAGSAA